MIADTLRQLQAMIEHKRPSDGAPNPLGEINPDVLMRLLRPDVMTSRELLDRLFQTEMGTKPTEEDYGFYPEQKIDMDMEQTPENMLINQMLAAKREKGV